MNPYHLSQERVEALAQEHGTPLYIVSRSQILANYELLNRCLPAVTLFYAMKANPHYGILNVLAEAGAGFDVASKGEIVDALKAGANPKHDLIFADTVKDPKHIAYANSIGLDDFTFDNASELTQIERHAPGSNVLVRLAVSNKGSVAQLSKKFGAKPEEAVPLLVDARERGLHPRGVSFHVGSQCLHVQRYIDALDMTKQVFEQAAQEGIHLEMIDIGGGFPVHYIDEQIDLEDMCAVITSHYEKLFGSEIVLVAEPGRSIVGDAVALVTKVISESTRGGKQWLYFDDGTYGSFMEVLLYKAKYPWKNFTRGASRQYVLAGPTCDSIDVFSRDERGEVCTVELPEMHLDDLLIAGSMGAYTFSEATRFNGFDPPDFVYID